jgi:hypothetical protein
MFRGLLLALMLWAASGAAAGNPAQGSDNPVLAFNLAPPLDWVPGMQFLDLMKTARPWKGHGAKERGTLSVDDLRAAGYIDAAGWVTAIPPEVRSVGTVFSWGPDDPGMQSYRPGRYLIRYRGTGDIVLKGDAEVISARPGEILFENRDGKGWRLEIERTDPARSGDYIRDISIVAEKHLDLHAAGALFNPDWLRLIQDARVLRFMDWTRTNHPAAMTWADRPAPIGPFDGRGHPVEYMVQLANEVGADPWFTMPHLVDAEYIRGFAEYVHANLDPRLVARVEWSNEIWNWSFPQAHWLLERSKAEWGIEARRDYAAKMAVQTALIWRDVFRDAPQRLRTVLGTHAVASGFSESLLRAQKWREQEPEAFVPPAEAFDELAVTTYFGNNLAQRADGRAALLRAIQTPGTDVNAWLAGQMTDPGFDRSIPAIADFLAKQKAVAEAHGLDLVLYEGGQHVHHSLKAKAKGATEATPEADLEAVHAALADFVQSPEMADLYVRLWEVWAGIGDGPFMQYSDVTRAGKFGSWGLYRSVVDDSPRARTLREKARDGTPWWGDRAGAQYLQGLTLSGSAGADRLEGTVEEDYLLGQGGDDVFLPGAGNDGIHGGAGTDRVIYEGSVADHVLREDPQGLVVEGPGGRDRLVAVEEVVFDDAVVAVGSGTGQ